METKTEIIELNNLNFYFSINCDVMKSEYWY